MPNMPVPPYEPELEDPNPNGSNDSLLYRLVHLNPALWRALVVSFFALLLSFGVVVSDQIPDSVITFILAVAAIVQALWTKSGTVPNAKVVSYLPEPVRAPADIHAGPAVTTASAADVVAVSTVPDIGTQP